MSLCESRLFRPSGSITIEQAISQVCAFPSPFLGILSVMGMFRQLRPAYRIRSKNLVQPLRVQPRVDPLNTGLYASLPCRHPCESEDSNVWPSAAGSPLA
jgi:hypothetical protein